MGVYHLVRIELVLRGFDNIRAGSGPRAFMSKLKQKLPEHVLRTLLSRLSQHVGQHQLSISKSEWNDAIVHPQFRELLFELGFDFHMHEELFELLDTKASGLLTTTEISEGLVLGNTQPR